MESKITIHTAPNFKPCIKVLEVQSEDVRDNLVRGLREQLNYQSSTFSFHINEQLGNKTEYLLLPVEDELKYFEGVIMQKYIADSASQQKLINFAQSILTATNQYPNMK